MTCRLSIAIALLLAASLLALDGQPAMHDPSTVVVHDGKYYTYGTGAALELAAAGGSIARA